MTAVLVPIWISSSRMAQLRRAEHRRDMSCERTFTPFLLAAPSGTSENVSQEGLLSVSRSPDAKAEHLQVRSFAPLTAIERAPSCV